MKHGACPPSGLAITVHPDVPAVAQRALPPVLLFCDVGHTRVRRPVLDGVPATVCLLANGQREAVHGFHLRPSPVVLELHLWVSICPTVDTLVTISGAILQLENTIHVLIHGPLTLRAGSMPYVQAICTSVFSWGLLASESHTEGW